VDPWGNVVAQCSENTNIATAELDLDYVQNIRTSMPVWQHRRNDLYEALKPERILEDQQEYIFGNAVLNSDNLICKTTNTVAFVSQNSIVPGRILF
jgi:predicted amidohydrolase